MIKILNRGYISVTPKTSFYHEVLKELPETNILHQNSEATIYLIEEDFWDNESVLKKHYKKILTSEKRQLSPTKNIELRQVTIDNIHDYFIFSFGNLVIDNENGGITITKDDLSD